MGGADSVLDAEGLGSQIVGSTPRRAGEAPLSDPLGEAASQGPARCWWRNDGHLYLERTTSRALTLPLPPPTDALHHRVPLQGVCL